MGHQAGGDCQILGKRHSAGGCSKDVDICIAMLPCWPHGIKHATKLQIRRTMVIPTLLYGSKTWVLKKAEENQTDVFNSPCLFSCCILSGKTKSEMKILEVEPNSCLHLHWFYFRGFLGRHTLLEWKTNILWSTCTNEYHYTASNYHGYQKLQWCGKTAKDRYQLNI